MTTTDTQKDFDVKEELKKLPHKPGVYIMRDEADTIMYVGKAVDLHQRVRSYFAGRITGRGPQIAQMVRLIARFEYIVTDSELEALILENNLIKENRPRYNTLLKDDKTYPYIRVSVGEAYPRVTMTRTIKRDKSRYFGPFTSAVAVRDTIDLVNQIYSLRTCNRVLPRDIDRERPCLYYHMHLCCAPCESGHVTREEYRKRAEEALGFLNGNYREALRDLKKKMEEASAGMAYEEAARLRDLIESVKHIAEKQTMDFDTVEDRDVLAIAFDEETRGDSREAVVQVFFVRDGKVIGREHFYLRVRDDESDALESFIAQFYSGTPYIPAELVLSQTPRNRELIEEWLSARKGRRVSIKVPERGKKEKLVELATQNAALVLAKDKERIRREEGRTIGAVKEIAALLGLSGADRMEAFDISNISGYLNVGSMVVYEKGKPKKSDYRKFRIRSVGGPDDYACMREVLTRRFAHALREKEAYDAFTRLPDLILMDGGKGQVHIAEEVLREMSLEIPVCGMVKDDRHRTRGLYYRDKEVPVDTASAGFMLITRIQDEAHRFAVTYHRSLRTDAQTKSILDEIPGVGASRRKALMRAFSSIEEIRNADVATLARVDGIPMKVAIGIHAHFHPEKEEVT